MSTARAEHRSAAGCAALLENLLTFCNRYYRPALTGLCPGGIGPWSLLIRSQAMRSGQAGKTPPSEPAGAAGSAPTGDGGGLAARARAWRVAVKAEHPGPLVALAHHRGRAGCCPGGGGRCAGESRAARDRSYRY